MRRRVRGGEAATEAILMDRVQLLLYHRTFNDVDLVSLVSRQETRVTISDFENKVNDPPGRHILSKALRR